MLACGAICQPTFVEREIRAFGSNASPVQVKTDAGTGFVKAPNNPHGEKLLIAELVAAELGTWFGLKIPPFAVIKECEIELLMMKNGEAMQTPLFFSKQVDGIPFDGSANQLTKVRDKNDITKLLVFDTWLANWDRYDDQSENLENILFVKNGNKYDIYAIDHTWAFDANFPLTADEEAIFQPKVYGNFPQFEPYIDYASVTKSLEKLAKLNRDFVGEIVNSVPSEWSLGQNASQSLVDFICRRAEFVVEKLPAWVLNDPPIPGLQNNA